MSSNSNTYDQIFCETFDITINQLPDLKYQDIIEWDSVGHMGLMAAIEEIFNIEMDIDDIIDFSSYKMGKKILEKYKISFNE